MSQSVLFFGAGSIAAIWFLVHLFLGGKQIARPLLATTELDPVVRDVQYLCWHFTSVGIVGIAVFFVLAAIGWGEAYAVAGTFLAAGFTATGVALVVKQGAQHLAVPQGWLFLPIAALGVVGLWA